MEAEIKSESTGMGTHHYWVCPACGGFNLLGGPNPPVVGSFKLCRSCLRYVTLMDKDSK
jgi:ribosomal protein S14